MKRMISNLVLVGASVLFLGIAPVPVQAEESSDPSRSETLQLAYGLLSDARYAYRPQRLDNALSSSIFDAYMDALDPDGLLFDQQARQLLEKHRHKLDTAIMRGSLEPIYEIAAARAGSGHEPSDKDEILQVFVDAYARTSDGYGSYLSPLVGTGGRAGSAEAAAASPVDHLAVAVDGERIGVIRIAHLHSTKQQTVSSFVSAAIDEFNREGIDALVLDLRGNGGGDLREVMALAGLFLGPAPVMQIREAGNRVTLERATASRNWAGRLAVLVDRGTAAGGEMLAAALQDHGRGVVLGERTFGRGTIQNLIDLDAGTGDPRRHGWLTLTIAEVFRLDGRPLDIVGVTPDQEWPLAAARDDLAARSAPPDAIAPAPGFPRGPRPLHAVDVAPYPEDGARVTGTDDTAIVRAARILNGLVDVQSASSTTHAADARQLERYVRALREHVVSHWVFPEGALTMAPCPVHVLQLPGGEVLGSSFDQGCPEDSDLRQSIEAAIVKSSPLPYAGFEDVFTRSFRMHFKAALEETK